MKTSSHRIQFKSSPKTSKSGLYVWVDGPSGPVSINVKHARDVPPFVERLLSIGRKNVRVGVTLETAVPYGEWKAGGGVGGKILRSDSGLKQLRRD